MRMTIRKTLGIVVGGLLLLMVLVAAGSYLQLRLVEGKLAKIVDEEEPQSAAAYELEINLIGTGFAVLGYLHDRDRQHLDRIREDEAEFRSYLEEYGRLAETEAEFSLRSTVGQGYDRFVSLAWEMVELEDQQTSKKEEVSGKFRGIDAILDEKIQASVQAGDPQAMEKMRTAMEMEININGIAKGLAKFLMTHQSAYVERVRDDEGDFNRAFRRYKNLSLRSAEKQAAAELSVMFDETVKLVDEIIVLHQQEEKDLREFVQIRRRLDGLLDDEIQTHARNEFDTAKESAVQIMNRMATVMVVLGVVVIAVAVLAWLFISAKVIRPITELSAATEKVAAGDFSGALPVGSDDELGELTRHFNTMIAARGRAWQELQTANKELNAFAHSVSHDLRTPLRAINGFSVALLEDHGEKLNEEGKDMLRRVRVASDRLAALIDAMLALTRITRRDIRVERVDLGALAQSVADALREAEPERQASILLPAEELEARGDRELLRVVLENLLGNAWKFTSRQPQAQIEFGVTQVNGERAYFVRDDGAGFDMAYADKLFGAFERLHRQDEFPGTGIGLATVERIVRRHGGRVWAEGAVNQGATFFFTL